MKLKTNKEVWIARIIAWVLLAAVSAGIIFMSTFVLGPTFFAVPDLDEKLAVAIYCPGAESTSVQTGPSVPTTSSPTGTYGHTVEITCYFADGSEKTIRNEQFALTSIGGMFGLGGLCGIGISIPLMLLPFFVIRKKKTH
ncbi:MAG: hypothetical protein UZ14_CFX002000817 [Chloroflexi bacterium OLB14]|nr:MAG: hypothetical protein UZ14_CFX002000817 [Chloroflexi bacterium OLB14]